MPASICPTTSGHRLRGAFTLVELLVVIAIIGILAGILIPVVGKVRISARTSQCKSNLRQIGVGIHLYINDNKGSFPGRFAYAVTDSWYKKGVTLNRFFFDVLAPYLDLPVSESASDVKYAPSSVICPGWTVAMASVPRDPLRQVYVLNHSIKDADGSTWSPWGHENSGPPQPFSRLSSEQLTRSWALQDADKKSVGDTVGNLSTVQNSPDKPVHDNKRNTLYFDGHVKSSPVPNNF
ncbi:N-terminal cleavage protein [Opitutaceae bacterium TAV5]|nr:N-terminal cleavage protein [Opitutaceae bacterium TAV5]